MELTIPMKTLDPANIQIGPLLKGTKLMASISYMDTNATLPALSLILPACLVHSYDPVSGHLILQIDAHMKKMNAIQDHILKVVRATQKEWFPEFKPRGEDMRTGFQPIVEGNLLHLYCPLGTGGSYDIHTYTDKWTRGSDIIRVGRTVRAVIRIQGVAFHQNPVTGAWTGKFRLQHRILGMYLMNPPDTR